tara:strand:+ start:225 stop:629 length:405 start_codon:yes stop_codon:yes gene_type:complete
MVRQYRGKTAKRPKMKVKKYTKNKNLAKKINLAKKKKTMRRRYKSKGGSVSTRSERAKEKKKDDEEEEKRKRDEELWDKIHTAAAKQPEYLDEYFKKLKDDMRMQSVIQPGNVREKIDEYNEMLKGLQIKNLTQ